MTRTLPARRPLLVVAACTAMGLVGCGGDDSGGAGTSSKVPSGQVALISGWTISQPAYAHWVEVMRRQAKAGGSPLDRKAVGQQALSTLIRATWADLEGSRQHIRIPPAELDAAYRKAAKLQYAGNRTFAQYRKQMGLTKEDVYVRLRVAALNQRFVQKVRAAAGGADAPDADRRLVEFNREYTKRWKAKTLCRSDVVMRDCSNVD